MATDGPSWADQWGAGGIGAMADEDEKTKGNSSSGSKKKKKTDAMAAAAAGLLKTKAAAIVGGQMIKSGTATGMKWVKNKCQKKSPPK